MNIEDKLRKSGQTYSICFFKEGVFARLYNESLFLALNYLQLDISINIKCYKKLDNQIVLKGGLPINQLIKRYPQLIKYNWGYKLKSDWIINHVDYETWRNNILKSLAS